MHAYTALESELSYAVYGLILLGRKKAESEMLMAMLGGQRMSPLKDSIKRLLLVTNATPKRKAFVDDMLRQLGEIQFFRDRLTHHFTTISQHPDVWINMNFGAIRERQHMEDLLFNVKALDSAANDLVAMRALTIHIFSHRDPERRTRVPKLPKWQYKPSMLVRHNPISSGSRKRPKRQPRA